MRRGFPAFAVVCGVGLAAAGVCERAALAGDNDLVLSRLGTVEMRGQGPVVVPENDDFRTVVSELGVVLAPRLLAPADTLGFGGFQLSTDLGFTSIASDQPQWRVREGSPDPTGAGGVDHGGGLMPTISVFMRKGLWLPLPSFEVGAGAVHLLGSRIWAAQAYAKLALHEGYHDLPLPSLAVRGAGSRMMGSRDLDLTIASVDVSISKSLGVGGTVNLAPYAGWSYLIVIARSEVLDPTPTMSDDVGLNFVLADQDNVTRGRLFGGLKLKYHVFAVLAEYGYAQAGATADARTGAVDRSAAQHTVTVSLGADF